eukprot:TRINITY_DN122459_c0_g1_i1.p1 TRINITY_DN122459_c0_g1~~TRINITY_DN122459_c0_g1_i1.p1  ORF type:complete len:388 (+),score=67.27 TRINITY_DN122459_c0_g1_i1:84-1247(+)
MGQSACTNERGPENGNNGCSAVTECTFGYGGKAPPPAIVMMDPGEDLDDEMSIILLTCFEQRGLLSLRGIVTTLAPSELRARLTRGILDELGMRHIPVAKGSDGGSEGKNTAFHRHPCMAKRKIPLDSDDLLLNVFGEVPMRSLILFINASLKDAADFMSSHEDLFVEKVRTVVVMGGVQEFDPSDEGSLLKPDTAHNNKFDSQASSFFYKRCQERGVPLVVVTRNTAYACQVPKSIYDDLAATGSRIGKHLQEVQQETMERLWRRSCAEAKAPEREGLPARCDKKWFLETFCSAADTDRTASDSCWDLVKSFNMYDPLAIIGGVPMLAEQFFDFECKLYAHVTHRVAGVSKAKHGVRDPQGLQAFLIEALKEGLNGYTATALRPET